MHISARKIALPLLWVFVCTAALWYVLRQVPWHDHATLQDGRRLRVLRYHYRQAGPGQVPTNLELLAADGSRVVVRADELARRGPGPGQLAIDQGFARIGQRIHWPTAIAGLLIFGPVAIMLGLRLKWLLHVQGITLSWWRATAVTYVGNFMNFFLFGLTGGDLIKAWCVCRYTPLKHEAVTAVFFDRLLGLGCMIVLAGAMVLVGWKDPAITGWGRYVGALIVLLAAVVLAYCSGSLRRALRIDRLVGLIPFGRHLRRVDQAVLAFRGAKRRVAACAVLTAGLQFLSIFSILVMGRALGMGGSAIAYLVYVPLAWIVAAVPISFQGLGVMEAAYFKFFVGSGIALAWQALALAMLARLIQIIWSLLALPLMPIVLTYRREPGRDQSLRPAEAACGPVDCDSRLTQTDRPD
ncbi:MAG: YbhN family protein [Phycisphaerae bacterium]